MIVIEFGLFSSKTSITVHLNIGERKNGELPLKAPPVPPVTGCGTF